MNDFGDDLWKCRSCGETFTDEEWTQLVPRWCRTSGPGSDVLLHEGCIKPYEIVRRLLK